MSHIPQLQPAVRAEQRVGWRLRSIHARFHFVVQGVGGEQEQLSNTGRRLIAVIGAFPARRSVEVLSSELRCTIRRVMPLPSSLRTYLRILLSWTVFSLAWSYGCRGRHNAYTQDPVIGKRPRVSGSRRIDTCLGRLFRAARRPRD